MTVNPFQFDGRDGEAADDRPEEVDEWFAPEEEVGYRRGLPLASVDYDDYPAKDELFDMSSRDTVKEVANHDLTNGAIDVAAELDTSEEYAVRAMSVHDCEGERGTYNGTPTIEKEVDGIELPSPHDAEGIVVRADQYDGSHPWESARSLDWLYLVCRLSTEEIETVLDTPDYVDVRRQLAKFALIDEEYNEGTPMRVRSGGRVGSF